MKKIILISALTMFLSCSKEEMKITQPTNCNCGVIVERMYYEFPSHTVMKIKNNCTSEFKIISVQGSYGTIGEQWCNY